MLLIMAEAPYVAVDTEVLNGHPWVLKAASTGLGSSWKIERSPSPGVPSVDIGPFSDREAALKAAKGIEEVEQEARDRSRWFMVGAGVLGVAALGAFALRSRSRAEIVAQSSPRLEELQRTLAKAREQIASYRSQGIEVLPTATSGIEKEIAEEKARLASMDLSWARDLLK